MKKQQETELKAMKGKKKDSDSDDSSSESESDEELRSKYKARASQLQQKRTSAKRPPPPVVQKQVISKESTGGIPSGGNVVKPPPPQVKQQQRLADPLDIDIYGEEPQVQSYVQPQNQAHLKPAKQPLKPDKQQIKPMPPPPQQMQNYGLDPDMESNMEKPFIDQDAGEQIHFMPQPSPRQQVPQDQFFVQEQTPPRETKFYEIAHYQYLFDVTTGEFLRRLFKAVFPFCGMRIFRNGKYDLYGPFWIMATLIVEIAIVGFINYNVNVMQVAEDLKNGIAPPIGFVEIYSLDKVAEASFVLVLYFIGNPLMILLLTKFVLFIHDLRFMWVLAIYGYSFSVFMVTVLLNVIPVSWAQWVFLGVSGVISWLFIMLEIYEVIRVHLQEGWGKFFIVIFYVLGSHVVFIIALKQYFLK